MNQSIPTKTYLKVEEISKSYSVHPEKFFDFLGLKKLSIKALQKISFELEKGQTIGIVGESGSGKTTLGKCIAKLENPDTGQIILNGINLNKISKTELKQYRKKTQVIFQDPLSSLNPRMTIFETLEEPLLINNFNLDSSGRSDQVKKKVEMVGLKIDLLSRLPHQLSGGQLQRVNIARALMLNPELIILDEPLFALDASIQAQILNLLLELQKEFGLAYVFISHDLRMVEFFSDIVAIMYLGKIVEIGPTTEVFNQPKHPYTKALLDSICALSPVRDSDESIKKTPLLKGEIPSAVYPPSGCQFHPRCPIADENCKRNDPPFRGLGNRKFACLKPS